MLQRLEQFNGRLARVMAFAGLVALMILALLTLVDGLMRWLFNQPIEGVRDAGGLAIALGVSCCIPIGLMERSNITVRFAAAYLGAGVGRLLDLLASVLTGMIVTGMAFELFLHAEKLTKANETTWILHIPIAPFWYGVAFVLWLSVAIQATIIARDFTKVLQPGIGGKARHAELQS